jgi:O-antigen/teichoic acid export membrane protein
MVQLFRAIVSVPVMVLYTAEGSADAAYGPRAALGVAVGIGALASIPLAATAAALDPLISGIGVQLLILAAFMPFLALQDTLRYLAFARGRPSIAGASDALWVALALVGSVILLRRDHTSVVAFLATWAAAGTLSGGASAVMLAVSPNFSHCRSWLSDHRAIWHRLAVEFVLLSGSFYIIYFGLAVVAGASELGRLKAAQALFGPVTVVLLGGMSLGVPESVRFRDAPAKMRRFGLGLAGLLAVISLASGTLVFVLLPSLGPRLFPDGWSTARPLIPLLTLFGVAIGIATGATSGLRALGENRWIMRARGAAGVISIVIALPSALILGANGALLGLAAGEYLFAVAAWKFLLSRSAAVSAARATAEAIDDPTRGSAF